MDRKHLGILDSSNIEVLINLPNPHKDYSCDQTTQ